MYAVITSGGKQYKVKEGDTIKVEKLAVEPGKAVTFDQILLIANGDDVKIGTPHLAGEKIAGEVIKHGKHDKVTITKFKRRKHHLKQAGHRQEFTEVKITKLAGATKQTAAKKTEKSVTTEEKSEA